MWKLGRYAAPDRRRRDRRRRDRRRGRGLRQRDVVHRRVRRLGFDPTNPNGRFELCIPPGAITNVDVVPSADPSQCFAGSYAAPGIAVADPVAIARGAVFSARAYTTARRQTLFAAAGLTYDPAKAQIFVHLATPAAVSSPAGHDAAQAFNGTAWAASETGIDVLLPNVTIPGGGTTSISIAGGRTVTVPVVADTITYATP